MSETTDQLKRALDLDRNEDWEGAHHTVQQIESTDSYWIHAYLHRKEGDLANSQYWYDRAGRTMPDCSLEQEWDALNAHIR